MANEEHEEQVGTPEQETPPVVETPPVDEEHEAFSRSVADLLLDDSDEEVQLGPEFEGVDEDTPWKKGKEQQKPTPEPSKEQPPPAAPPEPPKPPEPPPQPVQPAKPPEAPVQPPPQPESPQGKPTAPSPEEYRQKREEMIGLVARTYSNFTDEEKEKLQTAPEEVLPKMVGRLFVDVYEAVYNVVQQQMAAQLPSIIEHQHRVTSARTQAQQAFNQRWPKLSDQRYLPQIVQVARTYAAANPKASLEEWVNAVGATVSLMNGLPLESGPTSQAAQPPPVKPFSPPAPGAAPVARPGAPGGPPANPWAQMAQEWDEEF